MTKPSTPEGPEAGVGSTPALRVSLKADEFVRSAADSTEDVRARLFLDSAAVRATAPMGGVGNVASGVHAALHVRAGAHAALYRQMLAECFVPAAPVKGNAHEQLDNDART